ncbi:MAG: Fe-S cluster assembly protein SufB [Anaerolineales bacterium]|nr:Fe-S cluster assembly protein SufB [Anaerolineales bacterium]
MSDDAKILEDIGEYKYGFHDPEDKYAFKSEKGLSREVVENISRMKGEPEWMLAFRLKALDHFLKRPMPNWGPSLKDLNFDEIYFYVKPTEQSEKSWDDVPDDIKRTFDRLGVPEAERKFLAGLGAQYECLSGDTRVYTARGAVFIRDVIPGDVVFSFDEASNEIVPAPVKNFMLKGKRPVYKVKVGTRTIRATENHPFLVLEHHLKDGNHRGRYVRAWKYLRDLKKGDLIAVAKSLPDVGQDYILQQPSMEINWRHNSVVLPRQTSEDLMWWLGLYIGDGFTHHEGSKARVEFAVPATDQPLRNEFQQVTADLFGVAAQNGDPYRLTIGSTVVARYLETNGFSGGALEKRVPEWVAALPQEQILAFIGGYVDADGYVRDHAKNKDVMITSANPELLQDVRNLAEMCGVHTSNIHRFESKHPHDKNRTMIGYRMMFSGNFDVLGCRSEQRLARMGKRKFHHSYSMAEGTSFRNHVNEYIGYVRIDSIEPDGVEDVFDIEVGGPHNFVAEGLIVHNSEMVYHSIQEHLEKQGVIFLSIEDGLKQYPEMFREYFGTVIPIEDNKFAALNSAVWSGGSFVYVPKGVKVDLPLQAYFRLNTANLGQFERTLIIVDEGASVHYVEGCTAPQYTTDSFHSGVIEIIVKKGARSRYSTIQNWSTNVYNLVTQRAKVFENASHEWVDANLGSKVTMKYPSCYLMEPGARGEMLSMAFAGPGQIQDAGGKMYHFAPNTTSKVTSKSISKGGGRASFRGLLKVYKGSKGVKSNTVCDALLLDPQSRSDTYPYIEIDEDDITIGHEASVSKVGEEQLFYLMSRGLSEEEATTMVVSGFIEPLVKELPMEYAVEMNRLIALQMEGSIG